MVYLRNFYKSDTHELVLSRSANPIGLPNGESKIDGDQGCFQMGLVPREWILAGGVWLYKQMPEFQ